MAKTSNAAATLLSGPTIVSAIVSLWNFVFVPHKSLQFWGKSAAIATF